MIDTSFVHAYDESCAIDAEYNQNMTDINSCIGSIALADIQKRDLQSLGIFTESKENYYEESVASAVRSLGNKILEILQNLKDFIKDSIQKVKTKNWKKKDTDVKLARLKRNNPDAYNKLKFAVDTQGLDLNSFKDMKEFYSSIDEVLANIDKATIDPKSLKGKIEAAKTKLDNNSGTVKNVAAVLGLVVTAGGFVVTLKKYDQAKKKMYADYDTATDMLQTKIVDIEDKQAKLASDPVRLHVLADAANALSAAGKKHTASLVKLIGKLETGANKVISSAEGKYNDHLHNEWKKAEHEQKKRNEVRFRSTLIKDQSTFHSNNPGDVKRSLKYEVYQKAPGGTMQK